MPRRSGMLEAGAGTFAGQIPTILKVNSSNSWATANDQAMTGGGRRRAAARLLGDRLHHLSGLRRRLRDDGGDPRDVGRGQVGRHRHRDLVLSARRQALQGGRAGARRRRLCRAHGGPARRAYHQGQAADRPYRAEATRKKGYEGHRLVGPGRRASATSSRPASTAAASSSSRAAPPRASTRSTRTRATFATAAATARSSAATPSSARATRRWRCSTSWSRIYKGEE